jgi:predicted metal-dependent phosphoesterase TrpH
MDAGYSMIAIDLHVHTRRYSACAELLDPLDLAEGMKRSGLQGLVITEHDVLWGRDELTELNRLTAPCRVYRGVEVSAREGHVVVIGIEQADPIRPGMSVAELGALLQAQSAAAIWAHPPAALLREPFSAEVEAIAAVIDAVEVISTVTTDDKSIAAQVFAKRGRFAQVAGSDAHYPEQIGAVCTLFKMLPADERALACMIKQGEGLPIGLDRLHPGRICHVA